MRRSIFFTFLFLLIFSNFNFSFANDKTIICNNLKTEYNNAIINYSCNSSSIDMQGCNNLIEKTNLYIAKYKNNECSTIELKVKIKESNEVICNFYSTKYEEFLKKINVNNGMICKKENGRYISNSCQFLINKINEYNSIFKNSNCKISVSKIYCDLLRFNFINKATGYQCSKSNISGCYSFIDVIDIYLKEYKIKNCNTDELVAEKAQYRQIICDLYSNQYNTYLESVKTGVDIDSIIEGTKTHVDKFEQNKCSSEFLKARCDWLNFKYNKEYLTYSCEASFDVDDTSQKSVMMNSCSKSLFSLETFYSQANKYDCKELMNETRGLMQEYNDNITNLITVGTAGIKNNGIARGICYVLNIISGPFGKAIASLFIIILGMSFLSGHSEAMSFKSLMSIAFALALIFGSGRLADLISGNVYSCKYIILN